MKNYQKLYYSNYYLLKENGEYLPVTRAECFAKGDTPDETNPFKQRWYFDPEASYAARLPRNEHGYIVSKRNIADLKANERSYSNKWGCVWAGENGCGQGCETCEHVYASRTVELDRQLANGFDYETETESNPALIFEDITLRKELHEAVATLPDEERRLITVAFCGLNEREAAKELGLSRMTFVYRRNKVLEKVKKIIKKL